MILVENKQESPAALRFGLRLIRSLVQRYLHVDLTELVGLFHGDGGSNIRIGVRDAWGVVDGFVRELSHILVGLKEKTRLCEDPTWCDRLRNVVKLTAYSGMHPRQFAGRFSRRGGVRVNCLSETVRSFSKRVHEI